MKLVELLGFQFAQILMSLVLNFTEICFDLYDYLCEGTLVISNCPFSVHKFLGLLPDIFLRCVKNDLKKGLSFISRLLWRGTCILLSRFCFWGKDKEVWANSFEKDICSLSLWFCCGLWFEVKYIAKDVSVLDLWIMRGAGIPHPWYGILLNEIKADPGKATKGGGKSFWTGVGSLDRKWGCSLCLSRGYSSWEV